MTQQTHPTNSSGDRDHDGTSDAPSADREVDRTTSGAQTSETPAAPLWYGDPAPWRAPSSDYDPFGRPDPSRESAPQPGADGGGGDYPGNYATSGYAAPAAPIAPGATSASTTTTAPGAPGVPLQGPGGAPTSEVPMSWHPESPAYPSGTAFGGDGGWGGPHGSTPPPPPAPPSKPRGNRRVVELSAVALIAAVLASGGTFVAARYSQPASTASNTQTNNVPAPVIQASANNPDWTATAKAVSPSVVSITVASQQAEGQGSGVIINSQGNVLTNNHVATGAGAGATIAVTLNDGRNYDATIVGTDPTTDLAVLLIKNPPSDLKPISFGNSDELTVGQPVMAVGNPLGLAGTVTTGIVSALNRPVTTAASDATPSQGSQGNGQSQDQSGDVNTNAIQTSAAINPGNSGGALVTASGQLVGINSSIASLGSSSSGAQSGSIGIGFAIPVKEAKSIADQLIATGTAKHAYLGVSARDTTVTANGSKRAGALIDSLSAGTPAATAGLKQGDAVIKINGNSIESSKSLVATIHEYSVGDKVTVTVVRGGAQQDIQVTLAARPGQG